MRNAMAQRGVDRQFLVRILGRRASSGCMQLIFTLHNLDQAIEAFDIAWSWWFDCPMWVDNRGWRWASVRWFV